MTFTKLTFRAAAVLAIAGFAAPALPCTDAKQTQATFTPAPTTSVVATTASKDASKDAVAKQTPRPNEGKQGKTSTVSKRTATN